MFVYVLIYFLFFIFLFLILFDDSNRLTHVKLCARKMCREMELKITLFRSVLWHIKPFLLFHAKFSSYIYIKYI